MTGDRRATSSVQSLQRAAAIMRCFTEAEPELGVTDISARVGLHKSTVSRLLGTLETEGFIAHNAATGKYRLGVGLISLAGVALGRVGVRGAAYYHLDDLVEATQESASVYVLDGMECVNVLNKPSPRPVRYVNWIGRRLPLHCTASGKVILAGLEPGERPSRLKFPLRRFTDHTITSPGALESELMSIAERGFALALEEYEEGYNAIAAPIRDFRGQVVGALAVSGPAFRLERPTLESFIIPVCDAAARSSAELGYKGHLTSTSFIEVAHESALT